MGLYDQFAFSNQNNSCSCASWHFMVFTEQNKDVKNYFYHQFINYLGMSK